MGTKFNELKTKDMKKINLQSWVMWVGLTLVVVCFGIAYSYAESRVENKAREIAELSDSANVAKREMHAAQEECFWQSMALYNRCIECGGGEYITELTKTYLGENHLPTLEYYISAIHDMEENITDYSDRIDDTDFRMAFEMASNAESKYDKLMYELETKSGVKLNEEKYVGRK